MQAVSIDNAEHYSWGDGCDGWHLLKSADLSIIRERVPAGKAEKLHFHHRAAQFFYILSGSAQLVVDGKLIALHSGQGVQVPPGIPHRFENAGAKAVEFLVISAPPSHGDRENIAAAD